MKYLLLLLLLAPSLCMASEVTCYSYSKKIYHGNGTDFIFDENIIAFTDMKTHHLILVMGDCIIKDIN